MFTIEPLTLPGVLLIKLEAARDGRGVSLTTYSADEFSSLGIMTRFVEDYASVSKRNVIRGLHFQKAPYAQDKLVRCISGKIFDVVADCDPSSPTYGTYDSHILDAAEGDMLFIPGKYAHGFCVLSDEAVTEYKLGAAYHPESAAGARFDDPRLAVAWPLEGTPVLSKKDAEWPPLP